MSGDHFSGGKLQHEPVGFLPDHLMSDVEKNIVYACTDVTLRDPQTGKIFLGTRQTEPQLGPWLIGGRDAYGLGPNENAARQVKNDLGLDVSPTHFKFLTEYSTVFPSASANRHEHGRHTKNSVMLLDMSPDQVAALDKRVADGEIRDEYASGAWYDPSEIAKADSDFPDLLKQMVRDLHDYDRSYTATWDEAHAENDRRRIFGSPEDQQNTLLHQAEQLQKQFGLGEDEARRLVQTAGPNAGYSLLWARTEHDKQPEIELAEVLKPILESDEYVGDFNVRRILKENGFTAPEVRSDNGPAMRAILRGALVAIEANQSHEGELFKHLKRLRYLGRAGVGPLDPQ